MSYSLKKFETQNDADERNRKRQEEWERVRKPNDPVELPEVPYDGRSLYERLQEQREKKQMDFEEQIKFKNQFRGIDEDEAEFLSEISKKTSEIEHSKRKQELDEITAIKEAMVKEVSPEPEAPKKQLQVKKNIPKKNVQQNILKKAVKRKSDATEKKSEDGGNNGKVARQCNNENVVTIVYPPATTCVGILPGIANYTDSDASESTSSEEDYCQLNKMLRPPDDD